MTLGICSVTSTSLPETSALKPRIAPGDFLDCYKVASDMAPRQAAEIITNFPGWAELLVRLRNVVVLPFGLSKDGPEAADKVGFFPIERDTENELIAGFNDRHLNFRVSVMRENGEVYLATWVHRHNLLGRVYLATIMPFHILIARDALARVARAT